MNATALSVLMLGAFACIAGAVALFRRGDRQKAVLMGVMAVVLLGNVAIWTL